MKILAIADRPPSTNLKTLLDQNNPEIIVTLGDLDQSDINGLEMVNNIPKLGVYGNHDSGMYMKELGIIDMHLKTYKYKGIIFGGFQGCVRYKENPTAIMYTQEEAKKMLENFPKVDVMLAHCPPYGINDDISEIAHTGFIALKEYLEKQSPKYLFHGHTYPSPADLKTEYLDTKIVYVFGEKIITI